MQNKLLLSLWIAGGLLYAGGTIFLANALLGAGTRNVEIAADKVKTTPQPMQVAQCDPAPAAADPAKTSQDQEKSAAAEPKAGSASAPVKTAALPAGTKDEADQAADGDSVPQLPTADAAPQQAPQDAAPPYGPDQSEAGPQDANPDHSQGVWIVATTADVHNQPSAQAPSIYSLPAGRQVRVLARDNDWAQVQDVASGGTGWVDAQLLAPVGRGYGNGYDDANAEDPYGQEDWRWRRRHRPGFFGDFVRRALGGW
jgi:hypothetical protein